MTDHGTVEIQVTCIADLVSLIKTFRRATNAPLSSIRQALTRHVPIAVAKLYGHDHGQTEETLLALIDELDMLHAEYEIIVDGATESRQYLDNILQRWRDIGVETQMLINLEIGEPDIETLQWLQRDSSDGVFRTTLQQLVHGDGYQVDSETLEWAKRKLGDA